MGAVLSWCCEGSISQFSTTWVVVKIRATVFGVLIIRILLFSETPTWALQKGF